MTIMSKSISTFIQMRMKLLKVGTKRNGPYESNPQNVALKVRCDKQIKC